eukprot:gene11514-8198_t
MALRILNYLGGTKSLSLQFRYVDSGAPIKVFADASHNLIDYRGHVVRGHAGLIIAVGRRPKAVQKPILSYLTRRGLQLLATSLRSCPREIAFYQDNLSTIVMAGVQEYQPSVW